MTHAEAGYEESLALYRGPEEPLLLVRRSEVTADILRGGRGRSERAQKGARPLPVARNRAMARLAQLYPVVRSLS